MVNTKDYKKAVRSLWDGRATVTVLDGELNHANGRTEPKERVILSDEPCRLSFDTVKSTEPVEKAAQMVQTVTLHIDSAVDIPAGSKITVTQKGVTCDYKRSGKPAVYTTHQEIPLELFERWA